MRYTWYSGIKKLRFNFHLTSIHYFVMLGFLDKPCISKDIFDIPGISILIPSFSIDILHISKICDFGMPYNCHKLHCSH